MINFLKVALGIAAVASAIHWAQIVIVFIIGTFKDADQQDELLDSFCLPKNKVLATVLALLSLVILFCAYDVFIK